MVEVEKVVGHIYLEMMVEVDMDREVVVVVGEMD